MIANVDYHVSKWQNSAGQSFDNYECSHCQFSTLVKQVIARHMANGIHVHAYPATDNPKFPGKHKLHVPPGQPVAQPPQKQQPSV